MPQSAVVIIGAELVLCGELESLYDVEDTWDDYDKIAPVLDERLNAWRARAQ